MNSIRWLEITLLLGVTLGFVCGCSGKTEVTHSKEELQKKQIERARMMESEAGK